MFSPHGKLAICSQLLLRLMNMLTASLSMYSFYREREEIITNTNLWNLTQIYSRLFLYEAQIFLKKGYTSGK